MKTSIDLNEKLISRGMKLSGFKTKTELVNHALSEFVRNKDQRTILSLQGKLTLDENHEDSDAAGIGPKK